MTDNPNYYIDPNLDLDNLKAAQEERTARRSDTDDDDRENDDILDGLLRRDDGVADECSS